MTRAGFGFAGASTTLPPAAQRIASATSDANPPQWPSTRTTSIRASGAAPNTPMPLPGIAAIVPATWDPCHEEGSPKAGHQSPGSCGSPSRPSPSPAVTGSLTMS